MPLRADTVVERSGRAIQVSTSGLIPGLRTSKAGGKGAYRKKNPIILMYRQFLSRQLRRCWIGHGGSAVTRL